MSSTNHLTTNTMTPLDDVPTHGGAGASELPFSTITLPLIRIPSASRTTPRHRRPWHRDRWLLALLLCSICASLAAAGWALHYNTILLYGDAHSHLQIARRVFDNISPGLAQLGDIWLPLPHLIMIPFATNDYLWRTGLAGTIASMPCFVIAAVYVFLTARRLTHDSQASFIGALVFILNPNILYLQSTPLSEPVLFATLAAASYYFLVWAQEERLSSLVWSALATFLATLSRYDGWALFLVFLTFIVLIGWRKQQPRALVIAHLALFTPLAGLGIALWFLWNLVIFGSPLYFLNGPYSSDAQTKSFIASGAADTYHNLWQSIRTYTVASAESIGPVIFALGLLAVVLFLWRRRLSVDAIAALTVLVPFAFYVIAFFAGQDVMYLPHADHPPYFYYNARFGAEMAAPAGVFIGTLAHDVIRRLRWGHIALLLVILAQTTATAWGGVVALQDGQFGASCSPGHPIAAYLAQHYNGGRVLVDVYFSNVDLSTAGISFKQEVYEGDGALWENALQNPAAYVDWIIVKPGDPVDTHLNQLGSTASRQFEVVAQDQPGVKGQYTLTLLHRRGLPPLPNRPVSSDITAPYAVCSKAKGFSR